AGRRDPALAAAIAEADVLFVTLINTRASADWLAEQIARAQPRAVFAFESMPEVMALNRVGAYRVQGGKGSLPKPMQLVLKLLTQGREEDTLYAYTRLTKITARLLPLMPAKLHDFRTWLSVNIYWNQPDAENITQMIRLILRDCLGQPLEVAPPRLIPMMGCFHPGTDTLFESPEDYLRWQARRARSQKARSRGAEPPVVALLAFRKHVVQRVRYLDELIGALEAQGLA
ncbi:magnesium chelatase, partial [Kouleothrix aurantiaca]